MPSSASRPFRALLVAPVLVICALAGCSRSPTWSADDITSGRHYARSLGASREAARLAAAGNPDAPQLGIESVNALQKTALDEARLVQDSFLEKAHPELKEHFHSQYQAGLEAILKSDDVTAPAPTGAPAVGQIELQAAGVKLLAQWSEWLKSHEQEIRLPQPPPAKSG